ncbi:MAG: hypothetical protein IPI82_16545 [Candidatus Microthrix sp.]|nr:hypothetical protein [Candidatus Microthrix sp.]MBK7323994.1 hypothetical protein [Candidatus Microthrix sp.]
MEDNHRRDIALFRYSLIREAADPELSPTERGALVRRLAGREHVGPDRPAGDRWAFDVGSLDPPVAAGGYDALVPTERLGTSDPTGRDRNS